MVSTIFPWQTRCAISELLELAVEQTRHAHGKDIAIRLLTGTASQFIYNDTVVRQLENALHVGCEVRVIIWNDVAHTAESSLWLRPLQTRYPNLVVKSSETREHGEEIPHFLIVGVQAYRMEVAHPYIDKYGPGRNEP